MIAYRRPDDTRHRTSSYRIVDTENVDDLRHALTDALGVIAVVTKQRRLFIWEEVRIHLDAVEGLGSFIEFEAIALPKSDLSAEAERVQFLRETFEIDADDLIGVSYCDLLGAGEPAAETR